MALNNRGTFYLSSTNLERECPKRGLNATTVHESTFFSSTELHESNKG